MVFYAWETRSVKVRRDALIPSAHKVNAMISPFASFNEAWYSSAKATWYAPYHYQEQARGKLVRTELTWALSALFGLPATQTHVLCDAVEQMNLSSLVHDDLLDRDELRRGIPSVWKHYSEGVALVSGMYGYIEGLQRLAELNDLNVLCAGIKSLARLHVGQTLDFYASESDTLLTIEEYGYIAQANTGCFFLFILEACQCLKAVGNEVYRLLESMMYGLGVYYRYVNDYCDVNHIPHFEKKGFANDLEAGPKSFLMILAGEPLTKAARNSDEKNQIIRAYGDAGVFEAGMELIEQTFRGLNERLDAIHQLDSRINVQRLEAFVRDIRFQPDLSDDYYKRLIVQH